MLFHYYWPGGIPRYVKCDETPIPWESIDSITAGWRCFVKEKWVPRSPEEQDPAYEVRQRRALITEWIQTTQEIRESYQNRGPPIPWNGSTQSVYTPKTDFYSGESFYCIAPLDSSRNRSLWTKLRILSYDWTSYADGVYPLVEADIARASPFAPLSPSNFMMWCYVEAADFRGMGMTVHGTVVFKGYTSILADQRALETGMLLVTEFKTNGQLGMRMRVNVMNLPHIWRAIDALGKGLEELKTNNGFDDIEEPELYEALNMDQPILNILEQTFLIAVDWRLRGDEDDWISDIEKIAPGYLKLEELGSEADYDHTKFWER